MLAVVVLLPGWPLLRWTCLARSVYQWICKALPGSCKVSVTIMMYDRDIARIYGSRARVLALQVPMLSCISPLVNIDGTFHVQISVDACFVSVLTL